jgi:pyridoxamine 5'-phosphate oxidase
MVFCQRLPPSKERAGRPQIRKNILKLEKDGDVSNDFVAIRVEYRRGRLSEAGALLDPLEMFGEWLAEAASGAIPEPNAMTLATATSDGRPSARVVLLKGVDERGFSFFTNYSSRKGQELAANPWAALCVWWGSLERQIRIEGRVEKLPAAESDAYYQSRPLGARIGAIASAQSQVIANRQALEERWRELNQQYNEQTGKAPSRPKHWGGYLLRPHEIEFWQGGPHRLHDRLRYRRQENGDWLIERLAP